MGKKYDLTDSKKNKKQRLDVEFVKSGDKPKEKPPDVSFFKLYAYATGLDKLLIFAGLVSATITGILQPLNTVLFGNVTGSIIEYAYITQNPDSTTAEKDVATDDLIEAITHFAILNSLMGLGMFIFSYASTQAFNYAALRQSYKLRSLYLKTVLNQDIAWYDVNQTGDFASRMSDDLAKLEDGIGEKVPMFVNFQIVFVTSLIIALVKGWELALICLTSLPTSVIALSVVAWLTSRIAKNEMEAYGAAGAIAEEVLSSIRTVVAFGGQKKDSERYEEKLEFAKKNNIKRSLLAAIGFGILWFVIYSSYALAFWYGIRLVLRDRGSENPIYDPSNMVTVFFSVMTGSMNFGISAPYIEAFGVARAAGSKIFKVIENQPIINQSKNKGDKIEGGMKGNITLSNVKFHYPSRVEVPILQGLDLDVKSGETVALVGSSGCGKSTVIQLLQRFYDPIEGEVIIDGKNVKDFDLNWYRSNIGVVGQEPVLFGTTIMENIKYGYRNATEEDVKSAAKKANAHEFIKSLPNGYNTLVGERGAQLSGGQKQRIAIARALIRNPSILLLDEATSALDNTSEAKVQAALDKASKDCTTIIVAHRLSTIRGANKIVVLSKGIKIEQGTHDELMSLQGEYYGLVTTQVQSSENLGTPIPDKVELAEDDDRRDSVIKEYKKEEIEVEREDTYGSVIEVMKMNTPEWPQILIGCIGSIFMGCAMPLFAVLFGSILGTLASTDEDYVRSEANKYSLYFVLAGILSAASTFAQIFMFGIAGENLTKRIRIQMFDSMIRQEMAYFDNKINGVGALCTKLSGDAASVQGATGQRIGTILQSIATLILSIGLSMYYEWRLGLVALAFTPFILITTFLESRNTRGSNQKRDKSLQNATKLAVEAVSNVRTVTSVGCEELFHQLYMSELAPHQKVSLKNTPFRALVFGVSRSLMFFAYSACMYYGGILIRDGLYYGDVFKVSQALIMGTVSIANALAFAPNFSKGIKAAKKVQELLERVPKIQDAPNCIKKSNVQGNIQYTKIHFSYPTRSSVPILRGLDLSVLVGKTVALVGPSGCGKSTIIQLIERFYDPDQGYVALDSNDIKNIKLESLRSHLGIVSQEPNLFNKTIGENIAYGDNSRTPDKAEIIEAAKNANIHNFIASLPMGYDTMLGEKGTQLSGGQKQRIAIARALLRNPKVLLLDEATSALDSESEKIVQEALDNAKIGRTCITIAHRLTTIQDADAICVINEGVVAEQGNHQELLKKHGLYYNLYSQQFK